MNEISTREISPVFVRFVTRNLTYWQEQAPGFDDQQIRQLAPEHDNVAQAIELGLTLPGTTETATQLLLDFFPFAEQHGQWETWQPLVEQALDGEGEQEAPVRGQLLNCLGRLYRFRHRLALAISIHEDARMLGKQLADSRLVATSLLNLCIACRRQREYETATAHGREALALFEKMANADKETADALNALGLVALSRRELNTAEEYLQRAADYWRRLEMPTNLGRTLNNLALVLQHQGENEAALRIYQEAQEQLSSTSSVLDQIRVQNSLGTLYFKLEQLDQAEIIFRQLHRVAILNSGDVYLRGMLAQNLGNTLLKQGEYDEAERYLKQAIAIWKQLGDEIALANTLAAVAEIQANRQQIKRAVDIYGQALVLLEKHPDEPWAKRLRPIFTAEQAALLEEEE